jgi:hypothetical protein
MRASPSRPGPASRQTPVAEAAAVPRVVSAPVGVESVPAHTGGASAGDGTGASFGGCVAVVGVCELPVVTVSGSVTTAGLMRHGSVIPVPIPRVVPRLAALTA